MKPTLSRRQGLLVRELPLRRLEVLNATHIRDDDVRHKSMDRFCYCEAFVGTLALLSLVGFVMIVCYCCYCCWLLITAVGHYP